MCNNAGIPNEEGAPRAESGSQSSAAKDNFEQQGGSIDKKKKHTSIVRHDQRQKCRLRLLKPKGEGGFKASTSAATYCFHCHRRRMNSSAAVCDSFGARCFELTSLNG